MDNFNAFQKGNAFVEISDYCQSHGVMVKYRKGEVFAQEGRVSKHWGLVSKGYFAYTIIDSSGNERIIGFAFPGGIVGSYNSIINGNPSESYIVALSETEVVECDLSDLESFTHPNNYEWRFDFANSLYMDLHSRYTDIYRNTSKERYQALLAKCPEILQYITLGQLASYLMITQTHLSRIRREISLEN